MRARTCLIVLLLVVGGSHVAHAEAGERGDPATIGLQTVSGVTGGAVLAGLVYRFASEQCGFDCYGSIIPTVTAAVVGTGGGVYLAGRLHGGTGTALGTALGTAGGVVGSALVVGAIVALKPERSGWALLTVVPIFAGAILGYHLSADHTPDTTPRTLAFSLAF